MFYIKPEENEKIRKINDQIKEKRELIKEIDHEILDLEIEIDNEICTKHLYTDLSVVRDLILSLDDFKDKQRCTRKVSHITLVLDDNLSQPLYGFNVDIEKDGDNLSLFATDKIALAEVNLVTGEFVSHVNGNTYYQGNVIGFTEFKLED